MTVTLHAIGTAVDQGAFPYTAADDGASTMRTGHRECLDGTLETVKAVSSAHDGDFYGVFGAMSDFHGMPPVVDLVNEGPYAWSNPTPIGNCRTPFSVAADASRA